jgi:hypothetical protein
MATVIACAAALFLACAAYALLGTQRSMILRFRGYDWSC